MPSTRLYVGVKVDYSREVFSSGKRPTQDAFPQYLWVIGPFRTKAGARFMAVHGNNNPHCRCVSEAERLAEKYGSPEGLMSKGGD